jgi:hippurate hydrolase
MGLRADAAAIAGDLAELRHAIHREPEIGLDLPLTQAKVLAAVDGLPLEISTGDKLSSVTAVLRGGGGAAGGVAGRARPVVLLRGDMDALPVTEATGLAYSSRFEGVMHACGHDLHVAMLAGAARLLSARQAELPGDVIFMFQPGEEGYGGARFMISEGVLDAAGERPIAAYALHVLSAEVAGGAFTSRGGPMLAASDALDITVHGRGGHGSQPYRSADPIPAACEIVNALQTMVTRRFDVFDPVVITVGSIHAGTARNVIPDDAVIAATVRTFSPQNRAAVRDAAVTLARDIAAAHGLTADAEFNGGYPVTVNDGAEVARAEQVIAATLGEGRYVPAVNPEPGSEDFSYVLEQVPGAFVFLGACPEGVDPETAPSNHSAEAVFDDAVLADGTALYAALALARLG